MTEKQITEIVHAEPVKVEVTRNAKADYQWTMQIYAATPEEAVGLLKRCDDRLREQFLPKPALEKAV